MLLISALKTLVKKTKVEIIDEFNKSKINFLNFNVMHVQFSKIKVFFIMDTC